jgi:hypothetical protein
MPLTKPLTGSELEEHQVYFGSLPSLIRPLKVSSFWQRLMMIVSAIGASRQ